MSKKRTSTESNNDEQTKEDDSRSTFKEDDVGKRVKLNSLSDTTLQDLPMEILELILVKVVAIEVKSMKLSKSVWKEKADHVISRLGSVCSQWDSILTSNYFWNELNRALDSTGEETIRLDVLHQPLLWSKVLKLTTLKDEIFLLYDLDGRSMGINVYDRNNMTMEKDVIQLPGVSPADMAACSVSNCVYILDKKRYSPSVFRITKDERHHFKMSSWISDLRLIVSNRGPISVSANGNLIILSGRKGPGFACMFPSNGHTNKPKYPGIYIYAANGSLLQELVLSPESIGFRIIKSVIQKSNGNLVLLSANDDYRPTLLEIDATGAIVRQYQSTLYVCSVISFADIHGRILINDDSNRFELLDAEFNRLKIAVPPRLVGHTCNPPQLHFNSDRNEIVRMEKYVYNYTPAYNMCVSTALSILRLTEE